MIQKALILFFALLLPHSTIVLGQKKHVSFDDISVADGLPEGSIYDLLQDSKGYIWICSYEGLFKHNSKKIVPADQGTYGTSLTTNRVLCIAEDDENNLWVGTTIGLNKIERTTGKITQYINVRNEPKILPDNYIRKILKDNDGDIWIATKKGLAKRTRKTEQITPINLGNINFNIYNLYQETNKTILLATSKGLFCLNKNTNSITSALDSTLQKKTGRVVSIYKDNSQNIWLCSINGLWLYNHQYRTISKPITLPEQYKNKYVRYIVQDKDNNYWLATPTTLLQIDAKSNRVEAFKHDPDDDESISSNQITEILIDKSGNLWIGTKTGINTIPLADRHFTHYKLFPKLKKGDYNNHVQRMHQADNGSMFYYSYPKLYHTNRFGDTLKQIMNAPALYMDNMKNMPNGNVWLCYSGRNSGIWEYLERSNSLKKLTFSSIVDNTPTYNFSIDIADSTIIWVSNDSGFYKHNMQSKQTDLIALNYNKSGNGKRVRRFLQSKTGKIWIDNHCLVSYDKKSGEVKRYDDNKKGYPTSNVRDMDQTIDGKLWVAYETGIASYNEHTDEFKIFNTNNGLKGGNIVYALKADDKNNIWFTTFNHIICINSTTEYFSYYSKKDGVTTSFNRAVACKMNNGALIFGGTDGLVMFDPDRIKKSTKEIPVVINSISINNKAYESETLPEYLKEIEVCYSEKVISFTFNGLAYISDENQLFYKMQGFDKDWISAGTTDKATYTNLSPGTYTFAVRPNKNDKDLSNSVANLKVVITPMFWQTWWFKLMTIILVVLLLYYLWKNDYDKKVFKQQKELAEQNDRYKTMFLGNISHEIRTPLNAIIGLNKLLLDTPLNNKQHKYVHAASLSSESLLTLINDLLDQAKIESGKFHFVQKDFDIRIVAQQAVDIFQHKTEEKNIYLNLNISEHVPDTVVGDAVRLHQVLSNLISNAIKFTETGGVDVILTVAGQNYSTAEILFEVKDTGIGISEDKKDAIFESFHQVENEITDTVVGTGLGLSICKQLIEQQGGHIYVESKPNVGSSFKFNLKLKISESKSKELHSINFDKKSLSKLRVLLVEDTPFNQLLALELLKKNINDVNVTIAENGQEALDILETNKSFDIVLMDIKMPILNGYDTTIAIRKMEGAYYKELPIIALTANAVPKQLDMCSKAGMNSWITKPIDADLLLVKLGTILEKKHNGRFK